MTQNDNCINLQPGDVYFSQLFENDTTKILKTILGSCVSVTIWHSESKTAGMCHYLLAQEADGAKVSQVMQKYRYGEEALNYLLKKMTLLHPLDEYNLALFGGSNMYPSLSQPSIGEANVQFAQAWAKRNKLTFNHQDVLGNNGRSLALNLITGAITIKTYKDNEGALSEYYSNDC
jgi:chemotaxis protein CheD